jgi:hypothetical protein
MPSCSAAIAHHLLPIVHTILQFYDYMNGSNSPEYYADFVRTSSYSYIIKYWLPKSRDTVLPMPRISRRWIRRARALDACMQWDGSWYDTVSAGDSPEQNLSKIANSTVSFGPRRSSCYSSPCNTSYRRGLLVALTSSQEALGFLALHVS